MQTGSKLDWLFPYLELQVCALEEQGEDGDLPEFENGAGLLIFTKFYCWFLCCIILLRIINIFWFQKKSLIEEDNNSYSGVSIHFSLAKAL